MLLCVVSAVPQKSLGHEVSDLTSSQLLKLEKENQMLLRSVEELKSGAQLHLERDQQKLSQQVRRFSTLGSGDISECSVRFLQS